MKQISFFTEEVNRSELISKKMKMFSSALNYCGCCLNRLMKSWLQKNDIEINLTYKEGKFAIA